MKRTVMFVSLVLLVLIIVGCPNNTPGSVSINSISFKSDLYTNTPSPQSSLNIVSTSCDDKHSGFLDRLDKLFPEGFMPERIFLYHADGLGFTCAPESGEGWTITEQQLNELKESLNDIESDIDGVPYKTEFESLDLPWHLKFELDPVVDYSTPINVTQAKIIDDDTGAVPQDVALLNEIEKYLEDILGPLGDNGIVTLTDPKTFSSENDYNVYEENFRGKIKTFEYNGKVYKIGLEAPFNGALIVEVEQD